MMFEQPTEKVSQLYLEQISSNGDEKYGDLKKLIKEDKLPRIDGEIKILELGVGGGETMNKLKKQFQEEDDISIVGIDIMHMFANNFKKSTGSEAIVGDAGLLPVKENSFSAVNASAFFHEVSSYGASVRKDEKVFGVEAIEKSFNEIRLCLAENGVLTYRDVACPKDRLKVKEVNYEKKSWKIFIGIYLPILRDVSREVIPEIFNEYNLSENIEGKNIKATAQLHREIQRHYITFRDYFRKKIFPEIGVDILDESLVEKKKGNKKHALKLSGNALRIYLDRNNIKDSVSNLSIEIFSDEYDDLTDEIMAWGLEDNISDFYDEWFRREGREIYTYLESEELKKIAENKNPAHPSRSILFAESERMMPRHYYQRYLNRVIKNPEFEGKQIINFIKKVYEK